MKRFLLVAVSLAAAPFAWSQGPGIHGKADAHAVVNFNQLAQQEALHPPTRVRRDIPEGRPPVFNFVPKIVKPDAPRPSLAAQPGLQAQAALSPAVATSFPGGTDNDYLIPPDTNGAVGPNHVVSAINNGVFIFNRTGSVLSSVSLDAFWAATGATLTFDPHTLYDPYNGRWIMSSVANAYSASSCLLIGVSQTSDPTGNWNLYKVTADSGGTLWADYPAMGFNKNWIVFDVNMFTNASGSFTKSSIFAFSKGNLYNNLSGSYTRFDDASSFTQMPAVTYDNNLSTMYLVENYNSNAGGYGYIRVSTITGTVGSEVYALGPGTCCGSLPGLVRTPNPWTYGAGAEFAPQLGTTRKIDTNDDRIMTALFRNGSIWVAQTAFLPATTPTRTAAQWWQFDTSGNLQQFGRVDDAVNGYFYAFPSIAVNANNDALLGYSVFNANQYAAAGYSYRAAADAANTMQSTATLKAGESPYFKGTTCWGGVENRWGDYSASQVDPVNDLDLWTTQEYASSPNFPSPCSDDARFGTYWGKIAPAEAVVSLSPASLAFGNQAVGVASASSPVTLTNNGHASLTVSNVSVGANFSKTENCTTGSPIAAGGSCTVNVTLTPPAVGPVAGTLALTDSTSLGSHTVALTGNGVVVSAPVSLSAVDLGFGSQSVGNPSAGQTVTLYNGGSVTLTLALGISGDFAKSATCGATLASSASCTVTVTFTPTTTGARLGTLSVGDGTVTSPQLVRLSGTGVSGSVGPKARLSNTEWNFGTQATNTTGTATFTLSNSGDATLTVSSITTTSPYGFFQGGAAGGANNNCTSIPAGGSCGLYATFSPLLVGPATGLMTIVDNASGSPHVIRLFGTGVSGGINAIGVSSVALNFGSQATGTTSAVKTITVTNTGPGTVTISSVTSSGDFAVSGCVTSLAPAAACTISATFTPTAAGSRSGSIVIVHNAANSPRVIRLFGKGT